MPVDSMLPWVKTLSTVPSRVPVPTWVGLAPPRLPRGAVAPFRSCVIVSSKVTRDDLYPTVFTLATLLPITSIRVELIDRPETPEKRERIMAS